MSRARVARAPEDEMNRIDPPDLEVRTALHDVTVDLRYIALTVERASAVLDPNVELLEASHAIHRALVLLSDWNSEETHGTWNAPSPGSPPEASPNPTERGRRREMKLASAQISAGGVGVPPA
jgi:hypothetical protein